MAKTTLPASATSRKPENGMGSEAVAMLVAQLDYPFNPFGRDRVDADNTDPVVGAGCGCLRHVLSLD